VDGKELSQTVRVEADPDAPSGLLAEGEDDQAEAEDFDPDGGIGQK
jgi:hypothetical protein